jgi:asparaginyl-tRNA synthetase
MAIWVVPRNYSFSSLYTGMKGFFYLNFQGGIKMQKDFITVKELYRDKEQYIGKDVTVAGWIRTSRGSKNFGFIELNDGSFFKNMQVVYDEKLENFKDISKLAISSAILVEGKLVSTEGAKQPVEIQAHKVVVEGESDSSYPLQKKKHSFEYLRTIAHLRPRSNTFSAVFRIRSMAAYAIHKFFQERNFVYAHSPIITGSDAEGAGEMFRVTTLDMDNVAKNDEGKVDYTEDFFGKEAHLTVSGQLNAEIMALAFRNVYTFGPTFRAENSYTGRHASEFWMIEPEIVFADLEDNMDLAEDMIKYIISYVLENAPEEMEFFNQFIDKGLLERLNNLVNSEFTRITYTEAVELLIKSGHKFEYPVEWGCDLQTEHERYITEQIYGAPVFVTDYPKDIKAFYMRMNDDGKTVRAMDLLVPGVGEIVGGSQREEREDVLLAKIDEMGLNKEDYWWYLELRKFGTATHSGFGLGFERIIMYMTGMVNIRDVIPFPRTPKNAEF